MTHGLASSAIEKRRVQSPLQLKCTFGSLVTQNECKMRRARVKSIKPLRWSVRRFNVSAFLALDRALDFIAKLPCERRAQEKTITHLTAGGDERQLCSLRQFSH